MVVIAQKFYFATNNVFKFKNKRKGRAKKIVWNFLDSDWTKILI